MQKIKTLLQTHKTDIFFVVAILALLVVTGYTYGKHDQALYIPLAQKILNPNLYTKDAFSGFILNESANFLKLLTPLFKLVGIQVAFFIMYYLGYAILILSGFLIGKNIFNSKNAGYLFAIFVTSSRTPLIVFETFFATRALFIPILIFCCYLFLTKRYKLAYFGVGLAANMQQIFGLPVLAILLMTNAILIRQIGFKKTLQALPFFLVGFIPTLITIVQGTGTKVILTTNTEWYNFQRILIGGSFNIFYPGSWDSSSKQLLLALGCGFIAFLVYKSAKTINANLHFKFNFIASLVVCASVFLILVSVVYRVYPAVVLVQLQLMRSASLLTIFAALAVATLCYAYYTKGFINKAQILLAFTLVYSGNIIWAGPYLLACKFKLIPKFLSNLLVPICLLVFVYIFLGSRGLVKIDGVENLYTSNSSFESMATWLKQNTLESTYILAPTYLNDITSGNLRIQSERNIFLSPSELWMDVIDYKGYPVLKQKLNDISGGRFDLATANLDSGELFYWTIYKSYIDLTTNQIMDLAAKYNLDLFITESKYSYPLIELYRNADWVVWDLDSNPNN